MSVSSTGNESLGPVLCQSVGNEPLGPVLCQSVGNEPLGPVLCQSVVRGMNPWGRFYVSQ